MYKNFNPGYPGLDDADIVRSTLALLSGMGVGRCVADTRVVA